MRPQRVLKTQPENLRKRGKGSNAACKRGVSIYSFGLRRAIIPQQTNRTAEDGEWSLCKLLHEGTVRPTAMGLSI